MKKQNLLLALVLVFAFTAAVNASVVTLGQGGLMELDFSYSSDVLTTQVVDKRISGSGVEFDISFQGNSGLDTQMFLASSVFGGDGSLVFADLSQYDHYQIDVELVEVKGYTDQQAEPFEIWFSPLVYDSVSYKFFNPELISTAPGRNAATAGIDISSLATGHSKNGDWIFEIGYEIHMDDPTVWPSDGVTMTLLLSPTEGAYQIVPEPISLSFLVLGSLGMTLRRKKN